MTFIVITCIINAGLTVHVCWTGAEWNPLFQLRSAACGSVKEISNGKMLYLK